MVRSYKRKKEISYSKENLLKAVEEVKSKKMSSYQAAEQFGVPRSTIFAHVSGTRGLKNPKPGRPTVFDKDTELKIVNCIHVMEKCGYPLTRKEVLSLISQYIQRNGIVTIFKKDIPGDDWFRGFRKRHNLSLKKPQSVEIARRKACNPFTVYEYFEILEKIVQDLNLSYAPDRIYNLDETSFCQDPSKSKVVGKMGHRCTRTTSSPGRTNTTVLLAANANGDKIPPLIIFQGKYLWNEWFYQNETIKTAYAVSKKGWMETSIFEKYIKDVFVPAIGSERPVLLIYDGHSTHVDLSVIECALSNGITILKLPPHSSDVLQPLDCSVMKPLKDRWDEELIKWQRMHVGFKLPKSEFAKILTRIWENLNPVIISNGFKKTGIYPVNRNMIGKEKFDSLTWQKWENHLQSLHQCDDTANNADTRESNDFEFTTPHDVINNAILENDVFTTATIQEISCLRDLTLRIINQSIDQRQNDNYENSNRNEENSSNAGSQLSTNNKEKEDTAKMVRKNEKLGGLTKITNPKTFRLPLKTNQNISNSGNLIKVLDDKLIKPAYDKNKENYDAVNITLEELVLSTIARNDMPRKPKKRVGAEILTYPDVVARMKKAKEEQETIKLNKGKKKQGQQTNKRKGTKIKNIKKKQKQTKVKNNKKCISDSESTGSYSLMDSSETEDMDAFFDNILNENEDAYEFIEKKAKQKEEQETSKINKEKKQDEQENKKRYKEKGEITKTQEMKQKQTKVKKTKKWHSDNEINLDSDHSALMKPSTSKDQFLSRTEKKNKIPEIGTFVLAKFSSFKGKKAYKYVCQIEEVACKKIVVQGFKSIKSSKTKFRLVENDVSIIDHDDLIECLPAPKYDDKDMLYIFPRNVDIIEM